VSEKERIIESIVELTADHFLHKSCIMQSLSAKNVGRISFSLSLSEKFSTSGLVITGMGSAPSTRNSQIGCIYAKGGLSYGRAITTPGVTCRCVEEMDAFEDEQSLKHKRRQDDAKTHEAVDSFSDGDGQFYVGSHYLGGSGC
jgi:hypothetical protein